MLRRGIVSVLIRPVFSKTVKVGLEKNIISKKSKGCSYSHLAPTYQRFKKAGSHNQVYKYHVEKKQFLKFVKCKELTSDNIGDHVELHGKISFTKRKQIFLSDESGLIPLILSPDIASHWKEMLKSNSFVKLTGLVKQNRNWRDDIGSNKFSFAVLVDNIISVTPFSKIPYSKCKQSLNLELLPEELSRCTPGAMHFFFQRSHNCAALREELIGENVTLCGWVHTKHNGEMFTLEDGYGSVLVNYAGEVESNISSSEDIQGNELIFVKGVINPVSELPSDVDKNGYRIEVSAKELKLIKDISEEKQTSYVLTEGDPKRHASEHTFCQKGNIDGLTSKRDSRERENSSPDFNRYTLRSHNCGEINESLLGQRVHLMGWALYIRMNKFIVLRDKYGTVQLFVPDGKEDLQKLLESLLPESVISVTGTVSSRPRGLENKFMKSGKVEVCLEDMQIISKSSVLPFYSKSTNPSKKVLLKYRYLDFRHNLIIQKSLKMRCDVLHKMRKFLVENVGFLEVETPTLFRRTPGGAQEFVVPTRNEGEFYSLVQSPQQFKQLLMVGGIDRYFQIARCYRDETGQKDRQPEFTQLDIEMSFCNREGVLNLIEDLINYIWPHDSHRLVTPFPRLTFEEAMTTYGSDKPDMRFDCKISDVTDIFLSPEAKGSKGAIDVNQYLNLSDFAAHIFVVPKGAAFYASLKNAAEEKKKEKNILLLCIKANDHEIAQSKLNRLLSKSVSLEIVKRIKIEPEDVILLGLGSKITTLKALGDIRTIAADAFSNYDDSGMGKGGFHFTWILDFPLFESVDGRMESVHHPFTQPHPDDVHMLHTTPLKVRGLHYDLVLNGSEIGGGSIRIHDAALQKEALENILKLDVSSLKHLLEALDSGAPIHGGFALGIDRFIAHLCGLTNISDVIAFPKSSAGRDAMSGAPCSITDEDKALYHLK